MTLSDVSALLSRVGRDFPHLMVSRDARLLIEAILDEARKLPVERVAIAPVDLSEV